MAQNHGSEPEQLLTPSEVAAMFRVNPNTVTRWARAGKLSAIRTLGGDRRGRGRRAAGGPRFGYPHFPQTRRQTARALRAPVCATRSRRPSRGELVAFA